MGIVEPLEELSQDEPRSFTRDEISAVCVFWASIMTLLVLIQLSVIW